MFVNAANGGSLAWSGGSQAGGSTTGGAAGTGGTIAASAGSAAGTALFLRGGNVDLSVASGNTTTLSGDIADAAGEGTTHPGSITKLGSGTLVLNGNSSGTYGYAGGTSINAGTVEAGSNGALGKGTVTVGAGGTLKVDANASLGNALLLLDGSTLSGDGTVNSTVTVGQGATLSPGNSPGTFHGTDFVWGTGGHYHFEVNDFTGTAGTNWDLLSLTGGLSITATAGNPFVIDLVSLDPTNVAGLATNFSANSTYDLLLAWATGGITGFDPTLFSVNSTAFQNPTNGGVWSIVNQTNGVYLHFAGSGDVPEPGTLALLGIGAFGWLRKRRV